MKCEAHRKGGEYEQYTGTCPICVSLTQLRRINTLEDKVKRYKGQRDSTTDMLNHEIDKVKALQEELATSRELYRAANKEHRAILEHETTVREAAQAELARIREDNRKPYPEAETGDK